MRRYNVDGPKTYRSKCSDGQTSKVLYLGTISFYFFGDIQK